MKLRDLSPPPSKTHRTAPRLEPQLTPAPVVAKAAQTSSEKPSPWRWVTLLVLSLALAIIVIDTTLLNVSIRNIISDLHTDLHSIQWVITGYALTLAALTITGGRFGDIFGRKKMFITGAIIFAIGSFITSISQNVTTIIMGEAIIEGIGAALMMPATSALLVTTFKGRERAVAFGVWGAVAGGASAIGPILGGFFTTYYSWRVGFLINVFVVIILLLGSFLIKEARDTEEKPEIDWLGVILSSLGMFFSIFGIIESADYGWWTAKLVFMLGTNPIEIVSGISIVPFAIAIGVALLGLFVLWQQYREESDHTPLVSMRLFQNGQFTSGAVTTAILMLGQSGLVFAIPVFLQSVRGLDAFHTGLGLLPMSLALFIVAPISGILAHRFIPKYVIQTGLLINTIAYFVLRYSLSVDATAISLIPGLAMLGVGFGLVMAQISNLTLSAVSPQESGEASGVNNTLRQVGASLGSAIIGTVLVTSLGNNLRIGINQSSVIPDDKKPQFSEQAAAQAADGGFGPAASTSQVPPLIIAELSTIAKQATTEANRDALVYSALFAALGLIISFRLPAVKNVERNQSAAAGH